MAIPSGSGTEVLKRVTANGVTAWTEVLSGTANHIYIIISIICCNQGNASTASIRMNDGTNDNYIVDQTAVGASKTFIWNDKFVITGTDDLDIYSPVNSDWIITYIDQDWS